DFAAENLAAFESPSNVARIPEAVIGALADEAVVELFDGADKPADDIDCVDEMKIDFGQHIIALINPNSAGGFVNESVFEVAVGKLFVGRLEIDEQRVAPVQCLALEDGEIETAQEISVQDEI